MSSEEARAAREARKERRAERRAHADFTGGVYGSLLAASVVLGAGSLGNFPRVELVVLLVLTGVVFWLAHVHAKLFGERLGQHALQRLTVDRARLEPGELEARRDRRRQLDQVMVEERHPDLERVRHRHLVDLHQHRVRHREPRVHEDLAIELPAGVAARGRLADRREAVAVHRAQHGVLEQAPVERVGSEVLPPHVKRSGVEAGALDEPPEDDDRALLLLLVGEPRDQGLDDAAAEGAGQHPVEPVRLGRDEPVVADEDLVPALAGHAHRDVPARLAVLIALEPGDDRDQPLEDPSRLRVSTFDGREIAIEFAGNGDSRTLVKVHVSLNEAEAAKALGGDETKLAALRGQVQALQDKVAGREFELAEFVTRAWKTSLDQLSQR